MSCTVQIAAEVGLIHAYRPVVASHSGGARRSLCPVTGSRRSVQPDGWGHIGCAGITQTLLGGRHACQGSINRSPSRCRGHQRLARGSPRIIAWHDISGVSAGSPSGNCRYGCLCGRRSHGAGNCPSRRRRQPAGSRFSARNLSSGDLSDCRGSVSAVAWGDDQHHNGWIGRNCAFGRPFRSADAGRGAAGRTIGFTAGGRYSAARRTANGCDVGRHSWRGRTG